MKTVKIEGNTHRNNPENWLLLQSYDPQVQQFGSLCDNGAGDMDERQQTIHEKRWEQAEKLKAIIIFACKTVSKALY